MDDAVDELTRLNHQTDERRQRLLDLEHRIVDATSDLAALCTDRGAAQVRFMFEITTWKSGQWFRGVASLCCNLVFGSYSKRRVVLERCRHVQSAALEALSQRDCHQKDADAAAARTHGAQCTLEAVHAELSTLTGLRERHGQEAAELQDACAEAEARLTTLREESEAAESRLRCAVRSLQGRSDFESIANE